MTIGGISATQVPKAHAGGALSVNSFTDSWYASVPTGTSGDIVVTYSHGAARSAIEVHRVITTTPTPSAGNNNAAASVKTINQSITVPSGGGAIAFTANNGSTDTTTVSLTGGGIVKDASSQFLALGTSSCGASGITTTAGSQSVTGSIDGAANVQLISMVAWSP